LRISNIDKRVSRRTASYTEYESASEEERHHSDDGDIAYDEEEDYEPEPEPKRTKIAPISYKQDSDSDFYNEHSDAEEDEVEDSREAFKSSHDEVREPPYEDDVEYDTVVEIQHDEEEEELLGGQCDDTHEEQSNHDQNEMELVVQEENIQEQEQQASPLDEWEKVHTPKSSPDTKDVVDLIVETDPHDDEVQNIKVVVNGEQVVVCREAPNDEWEDVCLIAYIRTPCEDVQEPDKQEELIVVLDHDEDIKHQEDVKQTLPEINFSHEEPEVPHDEPEINISHDEPESGVSQGDPEDMMDTTREYTETGAYCEYEDVPIMNETMESPLGMHDTDLSPPRPNDSPFECLQNNILNELTFEEYFEEVCSNDCSFTSDDSIMWDESQISCDSFEDWVIDVPCKVKNEVTLFDPDEADNVASSSSSTSTAPQLSHLQSTEKFLFEEFCYTL